MQFACCALALEKAVDLLHLFRGLLWRAFVEYVGHVHSNQYMRQQLKQAMWNETAMGMITRSPIDDIPNLFAWSGLWQIECQRKPVGAREAAHSRLRIQGRRRIRMHGSAACERASPSSPAFCAKQSAAATTRTRRLVELSKYAC